MQRRKALRVGAIASSVAVVAGLVVVSGPSWLAHAIVAAPNAGVTFAAASDALSERHRQLGVAEHWRVEISAPADSPTSMSVWVMEPRVPPLGTVLVLHGIRSDKTAFAELGRQVADEGYRAVVPDLPGHGRSTGDVLTYGVREAAALSALLDELGRRERLSGRVGVLGFSYGGAIGVQLAALDARVRTVVAIAPFSSLRAVVPSYVSRVPVIGPLVPDSFLSLGVERAGALGRFDPTAASPLLAISRTTAQVLLIHGRADRHIPCQHSIDLHAAAANHSELVLVEGEDHASIVVDGTRTIATRGMHWLHRWLDSS